MVCLKAKESYHARCVEYEKMKRENASSKDLDKVEAKYKKASESCCFVSACLSSVRDCYMCFCSSELELTYRE